ncbi:hypothetical protein MBLNU230_g8393t1 [Neophaeotheca triangularis]
MDSRSGTEIINPFTGRPCRSPAAQNRIKRPETLTTTSPKPLDTELAPLSPVYSLEIDSSLPPDGLISRTMSLRRPSSSGLGLPMPQARSSDPVAAARTIVPRSQPKAPHRSCDERVKKTNRVSGGVWDGDSVHRALSLQSSHRPHDRHNHLQLGHQHRQRQHLQPLEHGDHSSSLPKSGLSALHTPSRFSFQSPRPAPLPPDRNSYDQVVWKSLKSPRSGSVTRKSRSQDSSKRVEGSSASEEPEKRAGEGSLSGREPSDSDSDSSDSNDGSSTRKTILARPGQSAHRDRHDAFGQFHKPLPPTPTTGSVTLDLLVAMEVDERERRIRAERAGQRERGEGEKF